ncbi:hypothetical protein EYF80_002329 [Liparis tanakae]|uniref:Uncharacterized protein n=1 Tax=Liparis tanakae TaxID=230148 RepID=A0A4Z2JAV5_9TELE|nr:hypothetical protein EYF80_002329 [Liparis tanakae]
MIDGIDESEADVCVVVGREHDIKELFALGVKLPQPRVHSLQSLDTTEHRYEMSCSFSMLKRTRADTQMVMAFSGLGWRRREWKLIETAPVSGCCIRKAVLTGFLVGVEGFNTVLASSQRFFSWSCRFSLACRSDRNSVAWVRMATFGVLADSRPGIWSRRARKRDRRSFLLFRSRKLWFRLRLFCILLLFFLIFFLIVIIIVVVVIIIIIIVVVVFIVIRVTVWGAGGVVVLLPVDGHVKAFGAGVSPDRDGHRRSGVHQPHPVLLALHSDNIDFLFIVICGHT